jgi:hypothetical protein
VKLKRYNKMRGLIASIRFSKVAILERRIKMRPEKPETKTRFT